MRLSLTRRHLFTVLVCQLGSQQLARCPQGACARQGDGSREFHLQVIDLVRGSTIGQDRY